MMHSDHCVQALAYIMQLAGVALVSVPIHQTGIHNYMRQTKIHISIGLLVQCLAFLQVATSYSVNSQAYLRVRYGLCEAVLAWSSALLSSWAQHMLHGMADHLPCTDRWRLRSSGGLIWILATGGRGMQRTGGTAACCCCWASCRSTMACSSTAAMLVWPATSKCLYDSLPRPLQVLEKHALKMIKNFKVLSRRQLEKYAQLLASSALQSLNDS